jgi:hypothetical protein
MLPTISSDKLKYLESLILKEMDMNGRIMVRSLDMIHAKTGATYAMVSEIAKNLQKRSF